MSPHFEQLLQQAQQLSPEDKLQFITRLFKSEHNTSDHAWQNVVGSLTDDLFFDEYLEAIAQNRRELDQQDLLLGEALVA